MLRELGMASAMVVPMKARGRMLGALMLVSSDPHRLYDDDALTFAEHLGRRSATAVDNALLYGHSEQRAHAARALAFVADGVMLVDEEGIVRIWNAAAEVITGLPEREIVGREVAEAIPGWAAIEGAHPCRRRPRRSPRGDRAARARPRRALAVDLGSVAPRRHRLRVPRPHGGTPRRAPEVRVRLDDLARAPNAAGRDLRCSAHPSPERACAASAARGPARCRGRRVGAAGADRQRHPLGEQARVGDAARRRRELRRDRSRVGRRGSRARRTCPRT